MYTLLWSLFLMAALISASVLYHHDREKREAQIFTVFAEMSQAEDDAWHEYRRARREHPANKK
jgi:hypothetical protein